MEGFGFGGGMGFGGLGMLLFWALVIAGIVMLARWLFAGSSAGIAALGRGKTALEILGERYARGEIGKEEFEQRKRDLRASRAASTH
ncbi:MAG: SHOCT domain-containing protein [Burkholderiales bacterium]|nr:SHOCT domain-containing protein [Burkholderiales bacterium]